MPRREHPIETTVKGLGCLASIAVLGTAAIPVCVAMLGGDEAATRKFVRDNGGTVFLAFFIGVPALITGGVAIYVVYERRAIHVQVKSIRQAQPEQVRPPKNAKSPRQRPAVIRSRASADVLLESGESQWHPWQATKAALVYSLIAAAAVALPIVAFSPPVALGLALIVAIVTAVFAFLFHL
jgi:hypothetical protein